MSSTEYQLFSKISPELWIPEYERHNDGENTKTSSDNIEKQWLAVLDLDPLQIIDIAQITCTEIFFI